MAHDEITERLESTASLLAEATGETPGVNAWQALISHREEAQVYRIGESIEEARRTVVSEDTEVTLYNLHPPHAASESAPALGATTFTISSETLANPTQLRARLAEGAQMASLTDNPPFTLPAAPAEGFPEVEAEDIGMSAKLLEAAERLGDQIRAAVRAAPGVRLGSAEIFASRSRHVFANSQGLRASKRETGAFLDLALLAGEGENIAEFHTELRRRRLSDLYVESVIAAYGAYAMHARKAIPTAAWEGPVIVSGEAVAHLFNPPSVSASPFATHASAEMAYRKLSRFQVGEFISQAEPQGDRLTLVSDATRPYGMRTSAFDRDGLPGRAVTLIADGVFRQPWADARYAQYLGVAPTGAIGNLNVTRGVTPVNRLRSTERGPVYEIVSFSWFNPDPMTGDFSAEIRLGYRHDETGVQPIKGGSLVGNLFAAFGDARFSAEPFTDGVYFGPAAIRFASLAITGG